MAINFNNFDEILQSAKGMMEKAEQDLKKITVSTESGAGLIKVTVNAEHQMIDLTLDDALLTESKETIEELIKLTVNDAQRKVDDKKRDNINVLGNLLKNDMAGDSK